KACDILVAPETAPDFLPAMALAAGIITNRGGVTSHAAIVSRELGKPCTVGVKDATSILCDGQQIELNADKGEIRLLQTTLQK
ncbi:MAG: PEP-utilizing enzyme, partial [Nanoarchaeota archaeon]